MASTSNTQPKITAITILKQANDQGQQPFLLGTATDLSNFSFFQRGTVKETVLFVSRTLSQRTQKGERQQVQQNEFYCYVHVKSTGLAGVIFVNQQYPMRAAFAIVQQVMLDFEQQYPNYYSVTSDSTAGDMILQSAIQKYADPMNADKFLKIQKDLDDTKTVLHQTIESVLKRGEKLEDLVDKSNDLSYSSQLFYKNARQTNSCCTF